MLQRCVETTLDGPFFSSPTPLLNSKKLPPFFHLSVETVAKGVGESKGVETGGEKRSRKNAGFGLQP